MKNALSKKGFTLIELALVTMILTVVGMALYGSFVSGINIWQHVSQPKDTEDVALFFRNISYDLRSSFLMDGIRFRGGRSEATFPTRIRHYGADGAEDSIGQVTYSFNRRKKSLYKEQINYSEIYRKKSGRKRMLADKVSSLEFEYFVYNAEQKTYRWVTSWQERDEPFGIEAEYNLPLIVKIVVGFPEDGLERKFVKTVSVPTACCWPFIDEEKK